MSKIGTVTTTVTGAKSQSNAGNTHPEFAVDTVTGFAGQLGYDRHRT